MSLRRVVMCLAVLGALTVGASAQRGVAEDKQFQAALDKEMVDGDLRAAIEEYRSISTRPNVTRELAAAALVRMAEAYEKLGDPEARAVYARIERDYADQLGAVRAARTRLGTQTSESRITVQQMVAEARPRGQVSPDGRFISTEWWDAAARVDHPAVREIATGRVRPLTHDDPGTPEPFADGSTFSPDGALLAYEWFTDANGPSAASLRIVSTAEGSTSAPRIVYENPEVTDIHPFDWSRNSLIAVQITRRDGSKQIAVVTVPGGELRVLKSLSWIGSTHLSFSPDGRYLAYDRPVADDELERDVFVIAVDANREMSAANNPGDDRLIGWSPDGGRLLISSDRGGPVPGLWAIPFRGGQPQTSEAQFLNDLGHVRSMGLTDDGALYYGALKPAADIFVGPFDPSAGRFTAAPERVILRSIGFNTSPAWSPDGKYLAYLSQRDPGIPAPMVVVIHSMTSGRTEREVLPKMSYVNGISWTPDGQHIRVSGNDLKGRGTLIAISIASGEAAPVVLQPQAEGCLPRGSNIGNGFKFTNGTIVCPSSQGILKIDPNGSRQMIPGSGYGVSSDERYLLTGESYGLRLWPLTGGEPRWALQPSENTRVGNWFSVNWVPGGQAVVYRGTFNGEDGMWFVPIDGRAPHKIDVGGEVVRWRFSPVTGQAAFTPDALASFEIRKMEHFLPR